MTPGWGSELASSSALRTPSQSHAHSRIKTQIPRFAENAPRCFSLPPRRAVFRLDEKLREVGFPIWLSPNPCRAL